MRELLTLFIFITSFSSFWSQDTYRTINGNMVVTSVVSDSVFILQTKKLFIYLDYETAKFTMKMYLSKFRTGNDSLDAELRLMEGEVIEYSGKLGLDYINTEGHPPLEFEIEGTLSTNQEKIIYGKGKLEHMHKGSTYECLLSMTFHLTVSDLGLKLNIKNLEDPIQVEVIQALLGRQD